MQRFFNGAYSLSYYIKLWTVPATLTAAIFTLISCVTSQTPFLEYSIAKVALVHARKHEMNGKHATSEYNKAINYFKKGEQAFNNRKFHQAKKLFNKSIKWAEKAEAINRYKERAGI